MQSPGVLDVGVGLNRWFFATIASTTQNSYTQIDRIFLVFPMVLVSMQISRVHLSRKGESVYSSRLGRYHM